MLKKILSGAFCIALSLMLITPAFAATPSVSVWYSDVNLAYYNPNDGTYYVYELSSNSSFNSNYRAAVSHAAAQWNPVLPISVTQTSVYSALNSIFGGTRSQLLDRFPSLPTNATGITIAKPAPGSTTVSYNGSLRYVYEIAGGGSVGIVEKNGRTATDYKNTATHEMGHLFGWKGHSSGNADVMYATATRITTLTVRDKAHLKQIYTLFYR